ncbi:MAG: hypothetical protein LBT89_10620 [Planctomycetaceae bacterium]|jgi:RNA ligase (TIGR02306 family)|nr:hypothetical protein [Planctomycetaceae bacterium]
MSRQLATVTRIKRIEAIPGADVIAKAVMTTNSWQVVVKKSDLNEGELAVYFEVDSFIPRDNNGETDSRFEFLAKSSAKKMGEVDGYRLRSVKLRNTLSQGLLLPVSLFPEITDPKEGDDVTDILGILLYEPPLPPMQNSMPRTALRTFPRFIEKTDQIRVQSIKPEEWTELRTHHYEVTVKMDGSSGSFFYNKGEFGLCSRNCQLIDLSGTGIFGKICRWFYNLFNRHHKKTLGFNRSVYSDMAAKYDVEQKLRDYCVQQGRNLALQGEICGEGIQSNREKIPNREQQFFVFDVFDIDTQKYISGEERRSLAAQFDMLHVPVIAEDYCIDGNLAAEQIVPHLLEFADGPGLYNDCREGLVFKSLSDPNVHFKVISNKYLLKYGL